MSKLTDIRNLIGKGEKSIKCPFCGLISEVISRDALNEYVGIRCNNCATYYIDISIFDNFDDAEYSYLISGYTRHFYPENGYGCFSTERLNQIIEKEKRFDCDSRKIAELIHYYDQKIAVLGQFAPIETYPAIAYCNGADDYDYIVRLAKLKKYIEFDEASYSLALTEEGARFSREELKRINLEKIMLHNSNSSKDVESRKKPVKIFISHSSKDEAAANAIVDLLDILHISEDSLICTSVRGHKIPKGEKIYDWIKKQYLDYDLHVILVLSDNYYKSAPCLNEMGATWALSKKYDLVLLPGFRFDNLKGCVDPTKVGISLDDSEDNIYDWFEELRDDIVAELGIEKPEEKTWRRHFKDFYKKISEYKKKHEWMRF